MWQVWEVIVQNIGCTYKGNDEAEAKDIYDEFVQQSENEKGMVVELYHNGALHCSHTPPPQCYVCGKRYEVSSEGESNHLTFSGAIDHEADANHLPHSIALVRLRADPSKVRVSITQRVSGMWIVSIQDRSNNYLYPKVMGNLPQDIVMSALRMADRLGCPGIDLELQWTYQHPHK